MAEFVMKDLVAKAGRSEDFEIASAAVSREELGGDIYPPVRRVLKEHGAAFAPRRARLVSAGDIAYYDRIYYMDSRNASYLLSRDVADPYYSGDFTQTWEDIVTGCRRILEECTC